MSALNYQQPQHDASSPYWRSLPQPEPEPEFPYTASPREMKRRRRELIALGISERTARINNMFNPNCTLEGFCVLRNDAVRYREAKLLKRGIQTPASRAVAKRVGVK